MSTQGVKSNSQLPSGSTEIIHWTCSLYTEHKLQGVALMANGIVCWAMDVNGMKSTGRRRSVMSIQRGEGRNHCIHFITVPLRLPCFGQAYLTKSGSMVFGFCPAGSTRRMKSKSGRRENTSLMGVPVNRFCFFRRHSKWIVGVNIPSRIPVIIWTPVITLGAVVIKVIVIEF